MSYQPDDRSPGTPLDETQVDEQLNAYLDGELDPEEMQEVELRLADDESYRWRLQQLQATWDMLDALPRNQSAPPASLTESTLEFVVHSAAHDLRRRRNNRWVWPSRIAVMAGLPLAAVFSGFHITKQVQQLPNRQLINDLPIFENVIVYDRAESIEFLSALEKDGVFAEQTDE